MVDLNSSQVNLARDFGETFAYLVKAADALLRVTHSCFGYVRDCSLVSDDNLPGDKSCLVAILMNVWTKGHDFDINQTAN